MEGIKHVGRKHNEIPFGSVPSPACGLHTDPSHGRMQDLGGEMSLPRLGGQEASSSFSLADRRVELVKGYCPFWL